MSAGFRVGVFVLGLVAAGCRDEALSRPQENTCSPSGAATLLSGGADVHARYSVAVRGDTLAYLTFAERAVVRVVHIADGTPTYEWQQDGATEARAPSLWPRLWLTDDTLFVWEAWSDTQAPFSLERVFAIDLATQTITTLAAGEHVDVSVDEVGRIALIAGRTATVIAPDRSVRVVMLADDVGSFVLYEDVIVYARESGDRVPFVQLVEQPIAGGAPVLLGGAIQMEHPFARIVAGQHFVALGGYAFDRETAVWSRTPFVAEDSSGDWICGAAWPNSGGGLYNVRTQQVIPVALPGGCDLHGERLVFTRLAGTDRDAYCLDFE